MKLLEFQTGITKIMKILEFPCDNYEHHENPIISYENHENYENIRITI